jgi:ESCRT-II complex subunit VPS25
MATTAATAGTAATPFAFPSTYNFPPFFTPQPNSTTRHSQLQKWSSLIQSWCRHHRTYRLSLVDAVDSPLFHNAALRKRLDLAEARAVVDWMTKKEEEGGGGQRAEWIEGAAAGGNTAPKSVAWIWWRRPEEWADVLVDWIDVTGQRGVVLTVFELVQGEATVSQGRSLITQTGSTENGRADHLAEFHGMDNDAMMKALNVLVKRGKASVFGNEGEEGVKFF